MSDGRVGHGQPSRPGRRLVVVCGLPGSGKTTLAQRLADEREGVRISADRWMAALDVNLWDADTREAATVPFVVSGHAYDGHRRCGG